MDNRDSKPLEDLKRIEAALSAAGPVSLSFSALPRKVEYKERGDPVTEADRKINEILMESLLRDGEGWLSEETADDLSRLGRHRVWIVDPVDGTKEFVSGIAEWCISVGLVEGGTAVAGGVLNPLTRQLVLGSLATGVTLNGRPVKPRRKTSLEGCTILASRSEVDRGEWARFLNRGYEVRPTGSVAYKLAMVASGLADATWTLSPKSEWDIAAGVALVNASGGHVYSLQGDPLEFNKSVVALQGLVAHCPGLTSEARREISSVAGIR